MAQRNIGIDVRPPSRVCTDAHCPFHGGFPVRGATMKGQVVSTSMERSAVVRREYLRYMPKFERYEKRTSRYMAHAPPCIDVNVGDVVTIAECRPISKTKSFVVVEARAGELRIAGEDATAPEAEEAAGAVVAAKGDAPKKGGK